MRSVLAGLLIALLAPAGRAGTPIAGFDDTPFVTGLSQPTAIAFLPNGDLLLTEQAGDLLRFDGTNLTTLATIPVCHAAAEQGLLGIAIDPNFASNGFVYLYRTLFTGTCSFATGRFNEVIRVTVSGGSAGSLTTLLTGIRTDLGNHNGGGLRIGPDGKLYVGVGDTGVGDNQGACPGSSTNPYAQDLNALEGKVLRLNLDGSIPADNPYFGQVGKRGEIFASGFRNPFRLGFDPATNALWVGDVGDFTIEEIDIVTAGGGYGWPQCEGTLPSGCQLPGDIDPIFEYWHGNLCPGTSGLPDLGRTVIGGDFAPGGFGGLAGHYIFADFVDSVVYDATVDGPRTGIVGTPTAFVTAAGGPVDLIFGPDGALYYTAYSAGHVRRVAPSAPGGDQLLDGKKLILKTSPTAPTHKTLKALSKDFDITLGAGPGSSDDPTQAGAQLRVVSASFDDTYALPPGNWRAINGGYVYKDADLSDGPVKTAVIKANRLVKISGAGAGLGHTLATDPNPVDVALTTGGTKYCMRFGGVPKFVPDKLFAAKDAPAPVSCP